MTASPPALLAALFDSPLGATLLRQNLLLLTPELLLLLTAGLLLLFAASRQESLRREIWPTALIGSFVACVAMSALFVLTHMNPQGLLLTDPVNIPVASEQLRVDLMGSLMRWTILLSTFLVILMSGRYLERRLAAASGEFFALLLCGTVGALLLTMAHDLVMFFVALETLGISSFLLAGFARNDARSAEAGLKFLLYGGGASACLLFGFSLLYGLSGGHTDFAGLITALSASAKPLPLLAIGPAMGALILAGLLFKLSAAPFHQWTPDVYEGAPTPVTAYLSVISKLAAFAAAIRIVSLILAPMPAFQGHAHAPLFFALALVAMVSMTWGNLAALRQRSMKRMLAYSTIAHVGYLLLGLALAAAGATAALPATLFYLLTYAFMNLGAFAAAIRFENETGSDALADYAGLGRKKPWLTAAMSIFLLSLAGIPIMAGFFSKFFLFQAVALTGGPALWLILFALLNSTISLYYYLNVIRLMTIAPPSSPVERLSRGVRQPASAFAMAMTLAICAAATLLLGLFAEPAMGLSRHAIAQLGKADPYARVFLLSQRSEP